MPLLPLEKELYLDKARLLFTKAVKKEIILIAPTLLKAEFANVLLKKKKLSVASCQKALQIINKANIIYTELTDLLIKMAIKLAAKYELSVYDGIYIATAEFTSSRLVSDDEKGHGKIKDVILLKDLEFTSE